jgi:hypothetical protein
MLREIVAIVYRLFESDRVRQIAAAEATAIEAQ